MSDSETIKVSQPLVSRLMKRAKAMRTLIRFAMDNPEMVKDVLLSSPELQRRLLVAAFRVAAGLVAAVVAYRWLRGRVSPAAPSEPPSAASLSVSRGWDWRKVREQVRDRQVPLPAVLVELSALRANVRRYAAVALAEKKTIRVASKSVRCPHLLRLILEGGEEEEDPKERNGKEGGGEEEEEEIVELDFRSAFRGVMCFSVEEAAFLYENHGMDDLLVAYPAVQEHELATAFRLTQAGAKLVLTVDCVTHLSLITSFWARQSSSLPTVPSSSNQHPEEADETVKPAFISLDVDVSWRPFGNVHLGALRSPLREMGQVERMVELATGGEARKWVRLCGVMAYEAHVAGLPDASPHDWAVGRLAKQLFRHFASGQVRAKRGAIAELIRRRGVTLEFFNGGGTGSFLEAVQEPWLTEVTVGSGFLQSELFDHYRDSRSRPALAFALAVTRIPQQDVVTCQGGGFVSSGAVEASKQPTPFLPLSMEASSVEGFGEVQTPVSISRQAQLALSLRHGDPLLFRPAKAGEIAERFSSYHLFERQALVSQVSTYRGLGQEFH